MSCLIWLLPYCFFSSVCCTLTCNLFACDLQTIWCFKISSTTLFYPCIFPPVETIEKAWYVFDTSPAVQPRFFKNSWGNWTERAMYVCVCLCKLNITLTFLGSRSTVRKHHPWLCTVQALSCISRCVSAQLQLPTVDGGSHDFTQGQILLSWCPRSCLQDCL